MIKNYIFDFGDVFINLDKPATARELLKLGKSTFNKEMITKNNQYEKGLLSTDEFLDYYQIQFPKASRTELKNYWNKILLNFPTYRLEFIEKFSKTNRCFLLSNINDLHLTYIQKQLGETFYNRFISCFEKTYFTHKIHLRKPDKSIFEYVFKESNLNPKQCFFIDDTLENTKTATSFGVICWTIDPQKEDVINLENVLQKINK